MAFYTYNTSTTKNTGGMFIKKNRFHFYMWAIFLFYEIVLVGLYTGHFGHPVRYILVYMINIGLFYFHALITMKIGIRHFNKYFFILPLLFLLQTVAYLGLTYVSQVILIRFTDILGDVKVSFDYQFILGTVFRAFYFIIFSTGYYFLENFLNERKKSEELENTRLENMVQIAKSETAYLRAQINPHFLFNTLNFIYHNTRTVAPIAADAISSLAEMMRYAVESGSEEEFIYLGKEINQVENLINIHQLRENHQLNIRFSYDEEVRDIKIIPFILITLAENMFKHSDLRSKMSPGEINIDIVDNDLIIRTKNLLGHHKIIDSLGTGIENIKKRLFYTYSDLAKLKYGNTGSDKYEVSLRIPAIMTNSRDSA